MLTYRLYSDVVEPYFHMLSLVWPPGELINPCSLFLLHEHWAALQLDWEAVFSFIKAHPCSRFSLSLIRSLSRWRATGFFSSFKRELERKSWMHPKVRETEEDRDWKAPNERRAQSRVCESHAARWESGGGEILDLLVLGTLLIAWFRMPILLW